jgi:subtilase family serine protease
MMCCKISTVIFFAWVGLFGATGPVFGAEWKTLSGHVPALTRRLTAIGHVPATDQLQLAIGVPLRDPAGLDQFLADVANPASPHFRKFLTPAEFTARFGPTAADYEAVKNFARTNGFKITATHDDRMLLDVAGPAAAVESAFHVTLKTYRHPTENRNFFAPDVEPTVAATLPLLDVSGLSDLPRPYSKIRFPNATSLLAKTAVPKSGSNPSGLYIGADFRNAYAAGTALNGTGQTVGLVQFDGYLQSDINTYESQAGLPNVPLQTVLLDGYGGGVGSGNVEVSLDIEMSIAMAPQLSSVVVFEGNPANGSFFPNHVLASMVASNTIKNLSCSWGWSGGPSATTENYFKMMQSDGQTFFDASGDSDAFTNGQVDNINFDGSPASSPSITQVGGTYLNMNGAGVSYASETVWNRGGGVGTSGGISSYYSIPTWQQGVNSFAANGGSTTQRNIPDVAAVADYVYVVYGGGSSGYVGGTSCAAPLWAGFMALVNQQAAAAGQPSVGFINPLIYEIANENVYNSIFNDITSGNNTSTASPNAFFAAPGYDLCTGLGTPNGTNLINALVMPDPLNVISNVGFNAVGTAAGIFNISSETFNLTNSSAAPLSWSIINTSAWLNVSSGNGTLAAAQSSAIVVSLNAVAGNLNPGTYAATLWFSNVTSGVAHARQFTVQTTEPLITLTTNNFYFEGPAGGPFAPAAQGIILTNARAGTVNWSLNNTSSWFTVSPAGGSLAGSSATVVNIFPAPAATNLASGIYNASFQVTDVNSQFVQNLAGSLIVGQSFLPNGGFETGNFNSWTLSGNSASFSVSTSSSYVHSGSYGLRAPASGSMGYLSQNLPTVPGQTYQLSFWFLNTSTSGGQQFQATWNGATVYSTASPPTSWSNQKLIVTATGTNTQLQFGFLTTSSARFGLDDITVTPANLPAITLQPVSQTNLAGSTLTFSAAARGTAPLSYQWRTNGVNLVNGSVISGATTSNLTLTAINSSYAGNYTLVVSNAYGAITSSVATLTVVLPPTITGSFSNLTLQCGSNVSFAVTAAGTPPFNFQWSLDGTPIPAATNTTLTLTNVHLPNHLVTLVVTNLYGSLTSNALLTVQDTLPPVISLNGSNPLLLEYGSVFNDPGASANDLCAGSLAVSVSGVVNTNAVGTNFLTYSANDGNGNTASATRTVIVRDTTPPTILWSYTNLTLAADTNCSVPTPDVTGTNFILARDLSSPLTFSQSPVAGTLLSVGTNWIVNVVADPYGNTTYVTNQVIVQDQTPPVIVSQPQNQTNTVGAAAAFSVTATACTPLSFQWFFNSAVLAAETNSTLNLPNLGSAAEGNYFVVVSAAGGASTSSVATLTVNLTAPGINGVAANPNGSFSLNLTGSPGSTYVLQATTNLFTSASWLPIATNTLGTNGVWQFNDPQATNFTQQFYRLKLVQ